MGGGGEYTTAPSPPPQKKKKKKKIRSEYVFLGSRVIFKRYFICSLSFIKCHYQNLETELRFENDIFSYDVDDDDHDHIFFFIHFSRIVSRLTGI